jgi:cytochrome c553
MKIKTPSGNTIIQFSSIATAHTSGSLYFGTICSVCHLNQSTSSCDSRSAEFKVLPKRPMANLEYQLRDKKEKERIRTSIEHPLMQEDFAALPLRLRAL